MNAELFLTDSAKEAVSSIVCCVVDKINENAGISGDFIAEQYVKANFIELGDARKSRVIKNDVTEFLRKYRIFDYSSQFKAMPLGEALLLIRAMGGEVSISWEAIPSVGSKEETAKPDDSVVVAGEIPFEYTQSTAFWLEKREIKYQIILQPGSSNYQVKTHPSDRQEAEELIKQVIMDSKPKWFNLESKNKLTTFNAFQAWDKYATNSPAQDYSIVQKAKFITGYNAAINGHQEPISEDEMVVNGWACGIIDFEEGKLKQITKD